MTTITANVVKDSLNFSSGRAEFPCRLITIRAHYPRCIHSELMTHRVFSRNTASSRAIPVAKMIQAIRVDPFVPLVWGANQKGMQAGTEIAATVNVLKLHGGTFDLDPLTNERAWLHGMDQMIVLAEAFDKAGYHKQIINRLLEPWMHIEALISSTQWSNFLALRDHEAAEPHMQMLARAVRNAIASSVPDKLGVGDWHLPYVTDAEKTNWYTTSDKKAGTVEQAQAQDHSKHSGEPKVLEQLRILSAARCAHLSYETVGTGEPIKADQAVRICDQLLSGNPIHASPTEHVAQADVWSRREPYQNSPSGWAHPELHGNFNGWCQWRKMLPGECQ